VATRLISYQSWKWSFSWRFRRYSASAFRSCVARHLCLQNFSRPSTKYMFFVGDVAVHLRLRLAIKIYTKAKRKLGFSKTLDWFFLFWGWSKLRDAKEKSKGKLKYSQTQTRLNLDYLFPSNDARKRGLLTVNSCIKVRLDLQAASPPS
jgi:hypothetical protein